MEEQMAEAATDFLKDIFYYQFSNGLSTKEDTVDKILNYFGLPVDSQVVFLGLLYDFYHDQDVKFFDRLAADEVTMLLGGLAKEKTEAFQLGVLEGFPHFFLGLSSYFLAGDKRREMARVSLGNNLKSSIYRTPAFVSICESVLMNFYRFIAVVLSRVKGIDYTSQDTLGKIFPVLRKYDLDHSIAVNVDLRNAINHGTVFYNDSDLEFKFNSGQTKKFIKMSIYDFDREIDSVFDVSSGLIVGFVRAIALFPGLLIPEFSNIGASPLREHWFRLLFHSRNVRCEDVDTDRSPGQATLQATISIEAEPALHLALRSLLKGLLVFYSDQTSYCITFRHPRSHGGVIRISQDDLVKFLEFTGTGEIPVLSGNQVYVVYPIQTDSVDTRRHMYFLFPEISSDDWYIENTENISLKDLKRFKTRLILRKRCSKTEINRIVDLVIEQLKRLETPANPTHEVKCGAVEIDALFFQVYLEPTSRKDFSLYDNRSTFVCLANYYRTPEVTRLRHGGVPFPVWSTYKKNTLNNVEYAWSPAY